MKALSMLLCLLSFSAYSQTVTIPDHNNWAVTDILTKGLKKEKLYTLMNRTIVRVSDSICSNRAHVWAYDFKRWNELDTAKIFLFYTAKNSENKWWYHAAPVINEGGKLWVMDAGFPADFKKPLSIPEWFKEFTEEETCREIRLGENELIELIYKQQAFPERTVYGTNSCYYALAPQGYWTPGQLALGLLGHDHNGRPTDFKRTEIIKGEAYDACLETSTTPAGWYWGTGKPKCNRWISEGLL